MLQKFQSNNGIGMYQNSMDNSWFYTCAALVVTTEKHWFRRSLLVTIWVSAPSCCCTVPNILLCGLFNGSAHRQDPAFLTSIHMYLFVTFWILTWISFLYLYPMKTFKLGYFMQHFTCCKQLGFFCIFFLIINDIIKGIDIYIHTCQKWVFFVTCHSNESCYIFPYLLHIYNIFCIV